MRRILVVTAGLVATGAALGAVLGALSLWVATALVGVGPGGAAAELIVDGAKAGSLTGPILAPLTAWSVMRRVPLWRAIGEPAIGTVLGSFAGSVAASLLNAGLAWSILSALLGFIVAVLRLGVAYDAQAPRRASTTDQVARVAGSDQRPSAS